MFAFWLPLYQYWNTVFVLNYLEKEKEKSWCICIVSLYVLAWKIPFGSADNFYMASSFFPAAVFEISLE